MIAERMEVKLVDGSVVSVVVLNELVVADIPEFDCAINASASYARSIRAEFGCVDSVLVIRKANCCLGCLQIPQLHCSVVRTGQHDSMIVGNLALSNPISMPKIGLLELPVECPHFQRLVGGAAHEEFGGSLFAEGKPKHGT